jgi:predicted O-methyltransferase YrrM
VFEIGTYNGLTTLTLAVNLPEAKIHTLDLPSGERSRLPILSADEANIAQSGRPLYEGQPAAERIVQHLSDSAAFDYSDFTGRCDLVYVDGAHSAEYLRNDSAAAFEIVAESGIVVWDDYWRRVPTVPEFLDALDLRTLYRLPGSRLVVWMSPDAEREVLRV